MSEVLLVNVVRSRQHVVTWWGNCSYRCLKVTYEVRKMLCPFCSSELLDYEYMVKMLLRRISMCMVMFVRLGCLCLRMVLMFGSLSLRLIFIGVSPISCCSYCLLGIGNYG